MKPMKRALLIVLLLAGLAAGASAQILSAKAFPDLSVGSKVADAQANGCNPDTTVTCVIIIEPELVVFPAGSLPTPSARTVIVDYRSPTLGPQYAYNGSATLIPGSFNGVSGNPISLPDGTVSTGGLTFTSASSVVLYKPSVNSLALGISGSTGYNFFSLTSLNVGSGIKICWSSTAGATIGSIGDTCIGRGGAAGAFTFGSGVSANKGSISLQRISTAGGTALVTGDVGTLTGWGSTASVSAVAGNDAAFSVAIASAGTGQAANATFVLTFHDGSWGNAPNPVCVRGDANAPAAAPYIFSVSATTVTVGMQGTPAAGNTYTFFCSLFGK